MIIHRALHIAIILLSVSLDTAANDAILEIKGLRIGMSKEEVAEMYPSWTNFTVAGTQAKYPNLPVMIKYYENKLDHFTYFFTSDGFDTMRGAFKSKYPSLVCANSTVGNAMGATYEQIECSLSDSDSVLQMRKYVSDSRTSVLSINSKRFVEELLKKHLEKKKDI